MTGLVLIPDGRAQIVGYLLDQAPLAAIVGDRIGTKMPESFDEPWIRVTEFDDPAVDGSRTEHLLEYVMQFDCYAGVENSTVQVSLLSRTLRAVLAQLPGQPLDEVVVTRVEFTSKVSDADPDFQPAREREIRDVSIWMHPR